MSAWLTPVLTGFVVGVVVTEFWRRVKESRAAARAARRQYEEARVRWAQRDLELGAWRRALRGEGPRYIPPIVRDWPSAIERYQQETGYQIAPCPGCGQVGTQDWAEVTQVGDWEMSVLPGLRWCRTTGCPREGKTY